MAQPRPFADLDAIRARLDALPGPDGAAAAQARAHDAKLTKPAGALGRLEDLAVWLCAWQGRYPARLDHVRLQVFAGNHGIAARGVSAYPAAVTAQMVANFRAGGAAVNQLAACAGARFAVHAFDLEQPTADFTAQAALTEAQFLAAFNQGASVVGADVDLLALGEMGIANTTSAAAVSAALFGGDGRLWAGPGTGLDSEGVQHKAALIDQALHQHHASLHDPLEVLRRLGGFELAAMAGAVLAARCACVPVLLDGFVGTAAAAVLHKAAPGALDHCLAGHCSAEPGHRRQLELLGLTPLLTLGMRLGEASGAALAIPILRAALACHTDMATFESAAVSTTCQ